ncbi:MAG TPA: amidohydrolase family protein, partial [Terriglobales bacterium]|nr:amidohydrolase family protein [Terriglobales bacterium]
AKVPVEIWHLKVAGKQNWGTMRDVVAAIQNARASGIDVTADQYPYVAAATSLGASIPPKYHEGGLEAFLARLKDPAQRAAIKRDLAALSEKFENIWLGAGGPEGVLVTSLLQPELKKYEGKTMAQIAAMEGKHPVDAAMDLVIASRDTVGAVYFEMKEEDVRLALQQPWLAIDCDAPAMNPVGVLGESKTHPRAYGTFPRVLGKYVREERVLRLEDAIRKFTSLPAQRVGLQRRGLLRPDYFADLTIFNPDTVIDRATFENPNQTSVGIEYVLVNGVLSVDQGKVTGQLGGRPLRGPGWAMANGRAAAKPARVASRTPLVKD